MVHACLEFAIKFQEKESNYENLDSKSKITLIIILWQISNKIGNRKSRIKNRKFELGNVLKKFSIFDLRFSISFFPDGVLALKDFLSNSKIAIHLLKIGSVEEKQILKRETDIEISQCYARRQGE